MRTLATVITVVASLACAAPAMADNIQAGTDAPNNVTDGSAVLRGHVSASALTLNVYFQYGKTTRYDAQTMQSSVLLNGSLAVKAAVTGLDPSAEYHYRFVVTGIFGASYGNDVGFKTKPSSSTSAGTGTSDTPTATTGTSVGNVLTDGTKGDTTTPGSSSTGDGSALTLLPPQLGDTPAAPSEPELGEKVVAGTESGTVGVKSPGSTGFATLAGNAPVPVGSIVDARRGTVRLVTALPGGATQTGTFRGAVFQVRQAHSAHGMTDIALRGGNFAACGSSAQHAGAAHAAGRSRVVRRLWGNDHHGRFRTRGSNSIATVRGTSWVTTDRCDGTLTSVSKGSVSVRDLRAKRTVLVRAGQSYLARGRR